MKKTNFGGFWNSRRTIRRSPTERDTSQKPRTAFARNGDYPGNETSLKDRLLDFITSGTFLRRTIGAILMFGIVGILIVWWVFLRDLPNIKNVENPDFFSESTVFYDNDGNEMYRFWENGKRIYVPYEQISQSIKDALIATEDPTFFTNPGIDVMGIIRAVVSAGGSSGQIKGTSTLSQQLIKNTLLSNERTFKRKVQEAYLAYQLNRSYSKEKILEMYLNAIEFGHGANGVEQASLTFFGKSAKDVGPLGATILASLPKGPTAYSPYSRRSALMGKIEAYPSDTPKNKVVLDLSVANGEYAPLYNIFKEYIKNLSYTQKGTGVEVCNVNKDFVGDPQFKVNSSGCVDVSYSQLLNFIGSIHVRGSLSIDGAPEEEYTIEYTIGRKDYVAIQMLEENKMDTKTFASIIYDGLEFQFNTPVSQIKYPYFVMYVQEQLEAKYGNDVNIKNGLKVFTTIRPDLQAEAEKAITKQVANNVNQGASSASLIAMDNTTGEILAMVGWPNYSADQNNMTTSARQPGSSFKPFIYALAISKNPIGPESPIADVKTEFGTYKPNNYDGKFNGIMSVGKALAYSRNIPAVKMYFLAGNEKEITPFARSIGFTTLDPNHNYGAAISLGAGEIRAIDMMQAYSVFANNGVKREAYAIKRIEDARGSIIEERKPSEWQQVFSPAASYIVSKILSNNEYRPESTTWRNNLTIRGKTVAAKTGTSNWENKKTGKIAPRDTWTAGYSPNITTIVWAGNVDGSPLKNTCDGINCAAPAWNQFMTYALKDIPNTDFKAPSDLLTFQTAKASGLLSKNGIENIMAVKLTEEDTGWKETLIDNLCGGPAGPNTPEDAIVRVYTPTARPIIDRYDPEWLKGFYNAANISATSWIQKTSIECERPNTAGAVSITARIIGVGNNILEVSWSGDRMIEKFKITVDGKVLKEAKYDDPARSGTDRVSTNTINADSNVTVELVDIYGYKYTKSGSSGATNLNNNATTSDTPLPGLPELHEETTVNEASNVAPRITVTNPTRSSISVYSGDTFNLRFNTQVGTTRRTVSVSVDGAPIRSATSGESFVIPVDTSNLEPGNHTLNITLTDGNGKTDSKSITLTILAR